jgi:hypothetical protein
MRSFAERFPTLFHVTREDALPSIAAHGLRPANAWAGHAGSSANRQSWTQVVDGSNGVVWLRWQRMTDAVLTPRLPSSIQPADWRAFLNSMVFFFPSLAEAEGLKAFPTDRLVKQVVLAYSSAELLQAGCDLRFSRWNSGFPDRARPPRLRSYTDFKPVDAVQTRKDVREVTVVGCVPTSVRFNIVGR